MVSTSSRQHRLDSYLLDKEPLGTGAYGTVYKGHTQEGQIFAVKVFTDRYEKDFKQELEAYKGLDHPNVVKLHNYSQNAIFESFNGMTRYQCMYLVFDLIMGGELFDYIIQAPTLTERTVRTIFAQILQGVVYIHGKGLAHRDLKLENILLDENFRVKIADFGTSKLVDRYGKLQTYIGTPGYMAPEIQKGGHRYKGYNADMFSLGCILFMLCTRMPVTEGDCSKDDSVYKYIYKRYPEKFWKNRHQFAKRYRVEINLSKELTQLIDDLICFDPDNRLTLAQVCGHPWMQQPFDDEQTLAGQFSQRLNAISPAKEQERQQKVASSKKVYMGTGQDEEEGTLPEVELPQMNLSKGGNMRKLNVLYSEFHPIPLLEKIQRQLERLEITPLVDSDEYNVTYFIQVPQDNQAPSAANAEEDEVIINVKIELKQYDKERVALVFTTKDGGFSKWLLTEHFDNFSELAHEWAYPLVNRPLVVDQGPGNKSYTVEHKSGKKEDFTYVYVDNYENALEIEQELKAQDCLNPIFQLKQEYGKNGNYSAFNFQHSGPAVKVMKAANEQIKSLDVNSLFEVKNLKNPSNLIKRVMAAVSIMYFPICQTEFTWASSQWMMKNPEVTHKKLLGIDVAKVSNARLLKLRRFINKRWYVLQPKKGDLKAISILYNWILAVDLYHEERSRFQENQIVLKKSEAYKGYGQSKEDLEGDDEAQIENEDEYMEIDHESLKREKKVLQTVTVDVNELQ